MITGSFGTKNFEVSRKKIYTPNGIGISKELNLEETEVSGKEPSVKVKGIKLTTVSFELSLSARFVDVLTELKFWDSTLTKKKAQSLKLGKWTLGDYYLTAYNIKDVNIGKDGVYDGAIISLSFTDEGYMVENTTTGTKAATGHTVTSASKATKTSATPAQKATTKTAAVKSSATTENKTPRKGSTIKPKKGVRWYFTGEQAYNRKGTSGVATVANFKVYNVYKKNGKVVCVNADRKGWLRLCDITLVKY